MPISSYLRGIRHRVGTDWLLLPSVTGVVWGADHRLLLVRRSDDGLWTLPGGIIDLGEAPAQALAREIWEEAGLIIRPERIIGIFGGPDGFRRTYPNGDQVEYVDIVFECRAISGTLGCRDGETTEARYFSKDELAHVSIAFPISLRELTQAIKDPVFTWDNNWIEDLLKNERSSTPRT